jgi:hypothetical protein
MVQIAEADPATSIHAYMQEFNDKKLEWFALSVLIIRKMIHRNTFVVLRETEKNYVLEN